MPRHSVPDGGFNKRLAAASPERAIRQADPGASTRCGTGAATLLVIYVTMVYGPIAAWLGSSSRRASAIHRCRLPYHIGNGWFGRFCRPLPSPWSR